MRRGVEISRLLGPTERSDQYSAGAEVIQDVFASKFHPNGAAELRDQISRSLKSLDETDRDAIAAINRKFVQNDYLSAQYHLGGITKTRINKKPLEWMAHATDRDIELFCRWNLFHTWRLTNAINRDKSKLTSHTMDKTHQLTNVGVFPRIAIPAMEKATEFYRLQGVDSFHSAGSGYAGMCGTDTIYLSNMYEYPRLRRSVSPHMKSTAFHEYLHGAGQNNGWFFHGIKEPSPVVVSVIEEAFVAHATTVAHAPDNRQPFIINPDKRLNGRYDSGTYHDNRSFLATTMEHTGIAWEQLSESYFLPRGHERGEFIREDIERKIGKFFGSLEGFFGFLEEHNSSTKSDQKILLQKKIKALTETGPSTEDIIDSAAA